MPTPRLTVDAVLKMAHAEAKRHAQSSLAQQAKSPTMRRAIAQVWSLVEPRLGRSPQVDELNNLIRSLTAEP